MQKLFNYPIALFLFLVYVAGCKNSTDTSPAAPDTKVTPKGDITDLIHNPVRSDGSIDSSYLPILTMDESEFDFGIINEGDVVEHAYSFTNTGTAPLLVLNATSTCGCTVPEWPDKPIAVGEKGTIKVIFDSKNKPGSQNKEVTIFANTFPNKTTVRIKGQVQKLN